MGDIELTDVFGSVSPTDEFNSSRAKARLQEIRSNTMSKSDIARLKSLADMPNILSLGYEGKVDLSYLVMRAIAILEEK